MSSDIYNPSSAEDPITAEGVSEPLFLDQVDRTPKQLGQFVLHGRQIPQAPGRIFIEGNQDINVAVGPKVVP